MSIGRQFIAPQGWGSLVSSTTYYLLANRPDLDAVTFAWFTQSKTEWRVYFIRLPRGDVEAALRDHHLVEAPEQASLPPWLKAIEGVSLDGLEIDRANPVKTYREHATSRLNIISPFLTEEFDREFDGALRPEKHFKRSLRNHWANMPTTSKTEEETKKAEKRPLKIPNALRALLWYCAFRLFGRELNALLPAFSGIGTWSRAEWKGENKRLGRPNKRAGTKHGHSAIGLAQKIQNAYVRFVAPGKTMMSIYRRALVEVFGCSVETLADGEKRFFHPEGLAFPSYQQFRYWTLKAYGLPEVQKRRWGEARYRSRLAPKVGAFSQDSANYLETAEADVYYIDELPRQLLSNEPAPALLVCRFVDMATGHIFGVGFSAGGERGEAYSLAKFSAVVPRTLMARIFGIPLAEEDWVGRGLPSREIVDRGAGSSPKADGVGQPASPIKELAPSWSGQSKATVESSHPRNARLEGEPTYVVSQLNVFQMAARELMRTPAENHRKNAIDRLSPQMLIDNVAGNPAAIAKYLLDRLRTSAVPMSTDVAIRKFLRPVDFVQKSDGLWLEVLQFSHTHLHAHGLPTHVPVNEPRIIKGYVYPFSMYLAWVEINGRLHEVEPLLRMREDREQLRITLADLHSLGELKLAAKALQREHGPAAMAEFEAAFIERFDTHPDAGERRRGKKPRPVDADNVPTARSKAKRAAA